MSGARPGPNEESVQLKVVEMTKFLVLTQNTLVPGFLEEKGPVDMLSNGNKKKDEKSQKL
jgi:hypothetical protein